MIARYTISQDNVAISDRRPVRAACLRVGKEVLPHDHEFSEICLVAGGSGVHRADGRETPMRRGDVFVTHPGQVHAIASGGLLEVWNVYYLAEWFLLDVPKYRREPSVLALFFSQTLFGHASGGAAHLALAPKQQAAVLPELDAIARECALGEPSALFLAGCFGKLLHYLGQAAPDDRVASIQLLDEDVWRVIERVEELLSNGEKFDALAVAERAPVGTDRLARLFKLRTGITPFAYYQRRRLQLGRRLLLDANRTITDVALSLGFADASHFTREFRREYRLTPRRYRRNFIEASA